MIEIVFLGTSASAPSIHRGLSAQIVLHRDYRFLVDCGEGTQRQILQSGLGFKRLNRVLLTHGHLDHILGLGGLISTFARWETVEHVEIYGSSWALERVHDLIYGVVLRGTEPQIKIDLIEVRPGVVLEDAYFKVEAFPVTHRGPCLGYLFREKARRPFLDEQAETLGVPRGPERRSSCWPAAHRGPCRGWHLDAAGDGTPPTRCGLPRRRPQARHLPGAVPP